MLTTIGRSAVLCLSGQCFRGLVCCWDWRQWASRSSKPQEDKYSVSVVLLSRILLSSNLEDFVSSSNKGCYSHCSSLEPGSLMVQKEEPLVWEGHPAPEAVWHMPLRAARTLWLRCHAHQANLWLSFGSRNGCLPRRECTEHSKRRPSPFRWCWASRFWAVRDEPWPWMGQRAGQGWQRFLWNSSRYFSSSQMSVPLHYFQITRENGKKKKKANKKWAEGFYEIFPL